VNDRNGRQKYCLACGRQAKLAANRKYNRERSERQAVQSEQERNIRQQAASYRCKQLLFSMRYTFDELIRMANSFGTSYGKFYAWINERKRLPEANEILE